jgi:glycine oxidase
MVETMRQDPRRDHDDADLVVVGAGVIGLSIAWQAARAGLEVCLVDPEPARGASWVAAGMLAPVTEAAYGEEELVQPFLLAARRWERFAEELEGATGRSIGYERCGTLLVGANGSDRVAIDELLDFQAALGLEAQRRSASECRGLVPALSPGVRGGAEVPGDHQVDNRRLLAALLDAVVRAGVHLVPCAMSGYTDVAGRRTVTLTGGGRVRGRVVVVCAGADTAGLPVLGAALALPVRPVKGQLLRLRGDVDHPLVPRTVRGIVEGRSCYLVPRANGSLVVGATSEERGFDRSVQVGAVFGLLDDARRLVPGIDELALEETCAGLRPTMPDNAPAVGWTRVEGVAVASGHYRHGILLAPLTADAVVALVTEGSLPAVVAGWAPERFDAR